MDLIWTIASYAGRLFLPIATYRLARIDSNSRQASLGAAALTIAFASYADINTWEKAYLDGPLVSAIGFGAAAVRDSTWPFAKSNLEETVHTGLQPHQ